VSSKGELVYSRERDEPEAPQVLKRQVAETMNQMLQKVVTDGTAKAAALEFTHSAGKTGTSSGPKDVWFVGYTGKYVAGVWLGNDDNRPMASSNTGGHLAAPVWHDFMSVAHTDMNIPTIPGLQPHPVQIAEQQRIAELRLTDPAAAEAQAGAASGDVKTASIMTDQTRTSLKKIASALRKAAGIPEPEPAPGTEPQPPASPSDQPKKPVPRDNRAEALPPSEAARVSRP
jgi:penicillin-binding protein 1A